MAAVTLAAAMTTTLRHEHIVRINDPENAAAPWLTRQQLWRGLHHTVVIPQLLDESIDAADVCEIAPGRLRREIHRGPHCLADEVEVTPNHCLTIRADTTGLFAGSSLARSFAKLDLIDEYRLMVHPIVLGKGLSLFDTLDTELTLELRRTTTFPSGVALLQYQRARAGRT